MGFSGRPSLACATCKQKRVKCDLTYPRCRNCERNGRTCPGVRQIHEVVFRDQTLRTGRAYNDLSDARLPPSPPQTASPAATVTPPSPPQPQQPPSQPSPSSDVVLHGDTAQRLKQASTAALLGAFAASFMSRADIERRGLHLDHWASMYADSDQASPLRPVTEAVSMSMCAHVFRLRDAVFQGKTIEAQATALINLSKGLKDPDFATSDQALISTVILCLMESTISPDPHFRSLNMHVNGSIDIIRNRGAQEPITKPFLKLFRMVRTQMVMKCIHESSRPKEFGPNGSWTFDRDMVPGRAVDLQILAFGVCDLRADCKELFDSSPSGPDEDALDSLVWRATNIQETLDAWYTNLPSTWRDETLAVDPDAMDFRGHTIAWNGLVHRYPSFYAAITIAMFRCLVIYTQSVVMRCETHARGSSELAASAILRTVDDICASVAYFGTIPSLRAPRPDMTMAGGRAGYYLLLPLYCCLGLEILPDGQRAWLRQVCYSRSQDPPMAIAALIHEPDQVVIFDGWDDEAKSRRPRQVVPYLATGLTLEESTPTMSFNRALRPSPPLVS